jgi:predicted transcriptional regulator
MYLQKFGANPAEFDIGRLVAGTKPQRPREGTTPEVAYSSADLEGLVQDAARLARLMDQADSPRPAHLDRALKAFKPQSAQWKDGLQALEEKLKRFEFRDATSTEGNAEPVSASRSERQPLPGVLRALLDGS